MEPMVDSHVATSDSSIVTKAVLRAADRLNVTNKVLARIIGVSEATVSRMKKGDYPLQAGTKPFELAVRIRAPVSILGCGRRRGRTSCRAPGCRTRTSLSTTRHWS